MGAGMTADFLNRGAQTLARHFQKAKLADAPDLDAGPIFAQQILQSSLHSGIFAIVFHINKVNHNQARQIPQAKLTGNLFGSL
jgi:hypothetical protein